MQVRVCTGSGAVTDVSLRHNRHFAKANIWPQVAFGQDRQGQAMTRYTLPPSLPTHWSPEQALATFEFLQAMCEQLWQMYGSAAQQA